MPPIPLRLQVRSWLDVTLFLSICLLETVPFTGLLLHEWLGIALAALVVTHLQLSWSWISGFSRFAVRSPRSLVNYFLNLGLFASVSVAIASGILVSQHVIPAFSRSSNPAWHSVHDSVSNAVVILAGLHLAMNWDWIAATSRRVLNLRAGRA